MSIPRIIKSLIRRARVSLSLPDTGSYQLSQCDYLGKTSKFEVIWPYGMNGRLPKNAQVLLFNIEGMEENKAGIGSTPDLRQNVDAEGEVKTGNPLAGTFVYFKEDGTIEAGSADATFRKLIDERFIAIYNAHVHPDPVTGNSGVPTVQLTPGNQETEDFRAS